MNPSLPSAVVCLCMVTTIVNAADLPPRVANSLPPAQEIRPTNWTGFYVGIHAGGGWGKSSWNDSFGSLADTVGSTGYLIGAQIGYLYQTGNIVIGVEGDISWANMSGDNTDGLNYVRETSVDWTSTLTARIGVAYDRWLVYGKGGVAWAYANRMVTDPVGDSATGATAHIGWTAGAGVEYALAPQWSAKLEYNYLSFGTQDVDLSGGALGAATSSANVDMHQLKAGVNFRF